MDMPVFTIIHAYIYTELDRSDGCTTLWIYQMPLNCSLQNGFFVMWISCQFIEKGMRDWYTLWHEWIEKIMLNEWRQTLKAIYCMIPFIWHV